MFICQNGDKLVKEAQVQLLKRRCGRLFIILLERRSYKLQYIFFHLRSIGACRQKRVAKFGPIFVSSFKLLEIVNTDLIIDVEGDRATVNLDQVTVYKF